jgi:exodeoxyribonuclease VII small subunit
MPKDRAAPDEEQPEGLEASMAKLESIVADLESGEFGLEEALKKFEEGLLLGKRCKQILDRAELRVKQLVENANGELEEEEFEGDR